MQTDLKIAIAKIVGKKEIYRISDVLIALNQIDGVDDMDNLVYHQLDKDMLRFRWQHCDYYDAPTYTELGTWNLKEDLNHQKQEVLTFLSKLLV